MLWSNNSLVKPWVCDIRQWLKSFLCCCTSIVFCIWSKFWYCIRFVEQLIWVILIVFWRSGVCETDLVCHFLIRLLKQLMQRVLLKASYCMLCLSQLSPSVLYGFPLLNDAQDWDNTFNILSCWTVYLTQLIYSNLLELIQMELF